MTTAKRLLSVAAEKDVAVKLDAKCAFWYKATRRKVYNELPRQDP